MFRCALLPALALLLGSTACDKEGALSAGAGSDAELTALLTVDAEVAEEALLFPAADLAAAHDEHPRRRRARFTGDCFSLIYPVTVDFPDATSAVANDSAELKTAVRAWLADRPEGVRGRPQLAYPLSVLLADGTISELSSRLEMRQLIRGCRTVPEPCVTLVFPVQLQLGDETVTVEDADALRAAAREFRRANRANGERARVRLVYPVAYAFADGTTGEAASRSDWEAIRLQCRGRDLDCYEYVFPLTVTNEAGRSRTIETVRELRRALGHAGRGGRHRIEMPYTVTLASGDEYTISERADLRELRGLCE